VVSAWGTADRMTRSCCCSWPRDRSVGGGRQSRGAGPRWLATATGVVGVMLGLWFASVFGRCSTPCSRSARAGIVG
jgi:hypothetical protein